MKSLRCRFTCSIGSLSFALVGGGPLAAAPQTAANVVYVDDDAVGLADGSSWADAFPDLDMAVGAAAPGSELWVAAGTYTPTSGASAGIYVQKDLTLFGGFRGDEVFPEERAGLADATVLKVGGGATAMMFIANADVLIDGFSFEDGDNGSITCYSISDCNGGALEVWSGQVEIRDCRFRNNSADSLGGAVYIRYGDVTFRQCSFEGNSANVAGGAVAIEETGTAEFLGCSFRGNFSVTGGAVCDAYFSSSGTPSRFLNCVFTGNVAHVGGALFGFRPVFVGNCVFAGNSAGAGGGVYLFLEGAPLPGAIENSVFWGNADDTGSGEAAQLLIESSVGLQPTHQPVFFSCVQGWTGALSGTGSFSSDPELRDVLGPDGVAATGDEDLRLSATSPCIDAGDPSVGAEDACLPPALGTALNDVGAYGGPEACALVTAAAATLRTDSAGRNVAGYTALEPVIGRTWSAVVDNSILGDTAATILVYGAPADRYLAALDATLLVDVDPSAKLLTVPTLSGTGQVLFTADVPDDLMLQGLQAYTQGVGFGADGIHLHNAYDLVLGF